jgi:restriction system protein
MALWLIRGGSHGEFEEKYFEEKKIYFTCDHLKDRDFRGAKDYNAIKEIVRGLLPDGPERRIGNFSGQAWAFVLSMKAGDLVVAPRKQKSVVAVGARRGNPQGSGIYDIQQSRWP